MDSKELSFNRIFDENYSFLYSCAMVIAHGDPYLINDIPDVLQNVFLLLWKHFDLLSLHPNLTGWLVKATEHAMKNLHRYYNVRRRNHAMSIHSRQEQSSLENELSSRYARLTQLQAQQDERLEWIRGKIGEENLRLLIRYNDLQVDSGQLASELGISNEALRARVSRLLRKLKRLLPALLPVLLTDVLLRFPL